MNPDKDSPSRETTDTLFELYDALQGVSAGSGFSNTSIQQAFNTEHIRRMLDWRVPSIQDISETLALQQGKIFAVRMDLLGEGAGLKQPVVAGLIVRSLLRLRDRMKLQNKVGFIDGASVSTGLALAFFDKKLGTASMLVTSRMTPDDVVSYVREASNNSLRIVKDQMEGSDPETAITQAFMQVLRSREASAYIPLLQTKHGAQVLQPLGKACADSLECVPDYVVTTLGSGSTAQGMAFPIHERFRSKIVIAEHAACPLLPNALLDIKTDDLS